MSDAVLAKAPATHHKRDLWPLVEVVALVAILLLAAWLRLHRVEATPGWYTDEGTHLAIGSALAEGRWQYLAVNQSTLLFARLPLFELLLAGSIRLFGLEMSTLRGLTGLLGVISVALVFGITRRLSRDERWLPLLAAFALAIYPQAVLYSRFGFSYNLLAPFVLLALWGLAEYWRADAHSGRAWLLLAAVAVGIGLLSDLMMGTLVAPLFVVVVLKRWRDALWSVPLVFVPFGIYALLMLMSVPDAFRFDLNYTLFRLNRLSLPDQIANVALNYTVLLSQEMGFLLGVIGLFLLRQPVVRAAALLVLLLPIIILGRTVALYHLSAYYVIPLLPLVALGIAALLRDGSVFLWRNIMAWEMVESPLIRRLGAAAALGFVIGVPLVTSVAVTLGNVNGQYPTAIDPFLLAPTDVRAVTDFLNTEAAPGDVVIASPGIAWRLNALATDFQMSVSYTGEDSVHLPGDLPVSRYAFDPRVENARFAVVDDLWRNWGAVHIPGAARILQIVEGWPRVFEAGSVMVYRKPQR
ncbi:MAG: glycosyltransferase family 39 protein [bacterium]|nr:glycosyltransferase family 39 protein [bacterium]